MKIGRGELVHVCWLDAGSPADASWMAEQAAQQIDPLRCQSVGWVMDATDKKIVLAATRTEFRDVNSVQMIPMGCVTSIQRLKWKKR